MGSVRRVALVVVGLLGPATVVGALLPSAAAASCAVMTISATPNSLVRLTVSSVSVAKGGCVEFVNNTSNAAQVTVAATSYSQTVPAKGSTSGSSNYVVTKTVTVAVSSGLRSGSGTITATAPSPTPSHPTSTPGPTTSHPASPTATPQVTPSRSGSRHHRHHRQHPVKISLPPLPPLPTGGLTAQPRGSNPVIAPGLTSATAAPSQPSTGGPTTAVATAIEPATDNKRGLPALIAAVLVIGLAAAYGRALLNYAPAVDNGSARQHRA